MIDIGTKIAIPWIINNINGNIKASIISAINNTINGAMRDMNNRISILQ